LRRRWRWRLEKLAALRQLDLTVAVRQQPVVAYALQARWQDMQQKAARELLGVQPHHLGFGLLAVVLPLEGDLAVGELQQPVVGDCHAMRVAAEILEDLRRPTKGFLA